MQDSPILIIGKTAKTGLRVDQRLRAQGYATRAVSRSTSPAFDWEDPTTWRAALEGTESAYVTCQRRLKIDPFCQEVAEVKLTLRMLGLCAP